MVKAQPEVSMSSTRRPGSCCPGRICSISAGSTLGSSRRNKRHPLPPGSTIAACADAQGPSSAACSKEGETEAIGPVTVSAVSESDAVDGGKIFEGDIICSVNGTHVAGWKLDDVQRLIHNGGAPVSVGADVSCRFPRDRFSWTRFSQSATRGGAEEERRGGRLFGSLRYSASGSKLPPV